MGDRTRGLYHKFNVTRTDGSSDAGGRHDLCYYFVLDCTHDKFARAAVEAYANACKDEYQLLAADLFRMLDEADEREFAWRRQAGML